MFNLNKKVLRQALDLSPQATVIVDLKTNPQPVVYVNQAFEAVSGYDAGELIGHPWAELLQEGSESIEAAGEASTELVLNCHPRIEGDSSLYLDMLPIYDQPGAPRYWLGTESRTRVATNEESGSERDVLLSVLRDTQMRLNRLDGRDSAGGVLTTRAFDDMLQRDWLMARREKRELTLIVLKVDSFVDYRTVFGRHAADSCMAKVGHAITGTLRRAGDLTGRISDDSFAALVGNASEQDAARLADKIASRVRGLSIHHPRSGVDRFVTISYAVGSGLPSAQLGAADMLLQIQDKLPAAIDSTGIRLALADRS